MFDYEEFHNYDEPADRDDPLVWVTKDKQRIPITELENSHLRNILQLLVRAAMASLRQRQILYIFGPRPHGEHAMDAFNQEFDYWCCYEDDYGRTPPLEAILKEKIPQWDALVAESHKRGSYDQVLGEKAGYPLSTIG